MSIIYRTSRTVLRCIAAAGLLAAASGIATAGECPADKIAEGATEPKGVKDSVLAAIDLGQEIDGLPSACR